MTNMKHSTFHRVNDPDNNPCLKESILSQKCMNDNHYVRTKCEAYFNNYKECWRFWHSVMIDRRRKGLKPVMPSADEREEIMKLRRKGKAM